MDAKLDQELAAVRDLTAQMVTNLKKIREEETYIDPAEVIKAGMQLIIENPLAQLPNVTTLMFAVLLEYVTRPSEPLENLSVEGL